MKKLLISLNTIFSFLFTQMARAQSTNLPNPLGMRETSIQVMIGRVINSAMGLIGSIALAMFIYGGLTWMLSAGNPEKVKQGRNIFMWAAIGLFVIFSSYALVRVVIGIMN